MINIPQSVIHDRYCGINCCMVILKLSSTIRASVSRMNGLEVKCVEEGLSRSYLSLCLTMQHVDVLLFASDTTGGAVRGKTSVSSSL